jgi:hypothetical protein
LYVDLVVVLFFLSLMVLWGSSSDDVLCVFYFVVEVGLLNFICLVVLFCVFLSGVLYLSPFKEMSSFFR